MGTLYKHTNLDVDSSFNFKKMKQKIKSNPMAPIRNLLIALLIVLSFCVVSIGVCVMEIFNQSGVQYELSQQLAYVCAVIGGLVERAAYVVDLAFYVCWYIPPHLYLMIEYSLEQLNDKLYNVVKESTHVQQIHNLMTDIIMPFI